MGFSIEILREVNEKYVRMGKERRLQEQGGSALERGKGGEKRGS